MVVTPATALAVAHMTASCPCDGTWTVGAARTLESCPANTCDDSEWLPLRDWAVGDDGFGIMRRTDNGLRVSALRPSEAEGYSQGLLVDNLPAASQSAVGECRRESASTTTSAPTSEPSRRGASLGIIIGACVGGLVVLLIVLVVVWQRRRRGATTIRAKVFHNEAYQLDREDAGEAW